MSLVSHIAHAASAGSVTTTGVIGVEKTKATLEGITSLTGVTERGFEFGTTASYGQTIQDTTPLTEFATVVHSAKEGDGTPKKIILDTDNNIVALYDDYGHSTTKIVKYSVSGDKLLEFSSPGSSDGLLQNPGTIATDSLNNIYVADTGNNRIQKFDANGNFILAFGTQGVSIGEFQDPVSVSIDNSGKLYVADRGNSRIQKFDSSGNFLLSFGESGFDDEQFLTLVSVAADSSGNVYTLEHSDGSGINRSRVQKFSSDGSFLLSWDDENSNNLDFHYPTTIRMDRNDDVYILSDGDYYIQKFSPQGAFIRGWQYYTSGSSSGSGGDNQFARIPGDVAFDDGNNLYVADTQNIRVQRSGASIQSELTSLSCGTQYHSRAYAVNGSGTSYGQDASFTTLGCAATGGLQFTANQLPDAEWDVGEGNRSLVYSGQLETEGGIGQSRFEVIEGNPPPGISVAGTYGSLYGYLYDNEVTVDSTYTFTVAAYDEAGQSVTKQFSIYVPPIPPINFPGDELTAVTQNMYYSTYLGLNWQKGPITTSVTQGQLPPGLQLHADDINMFVNIRGIASAAGSWTFTLESSDGVNVAAHEYTLVVTAYTPPVPVIPPALVSITSPTQSAQMTGSFVTIEGTAPANMIVEVYADTIHLGGVRANANGVWKYVANNLVPGAHQFTAKYIPQQKVAYVTSVVQTQASNEIQSTVQTVDVASGAVIDSYDLPDGVLLSGITLNDDGTKLFLSAISFRDTSTSYSSRVYEYDPITRSLRVVYDTGTFISGIAPSATLSPDGLKMYTDGFRSVVVIDTATKLVIQTVPIGSQTTDPAQAYEGTFPVVVDKTLSADGKTLNTLFVEITINQNEANTTKLKLQSTNIETLSSRETILQNDYQVRSRSQSPVIFPKLVQGDDEVYVLYRGDSKSDYVERVAADSGVISSIVNSNMLRGLSTDAVISNGIFDKSTNALYLSVISGDFEGNIDTYRGGYVRLNSDNSLTNFMDAQGYDVSTGIAGLYFDETAHTIYKPYVVRFDDLYAGVKGELFDTQTGMYSYTDATLPGYIEIFPQQGGNTFGGTAPTQYAYRSFTTTGDDSVTPVNPVEPQVPADPVTTTVSPPIPMDPAASVKSESRPEVKRDNRENITTKENYAPVFNSGIGDQSPEGSKDTALSSSNPSTDGLPGKSSTPFQKAVEFTADRLGLSPQTLVTAIPWLLLVLLLLFVAIFTIMLLYRLYIVERMRSLVEKQRLLNHEKRSLIALSSHYLRTPMTILNAGVDMLTDESRTKTVLSSAVTQLGTVVSTIIGKMEADDGMAETWHPVEQKIKNTKLQQVTLILPVIVVIGTMAVFNIVVARYTTLLVNVSVTVIQLILAIIAAVLIYVIYNSYQQHAAIESYQKELLDYHETLDVNRNRFIQDVVDDLVPAVYGVDSAVAQGLPDDAAAYIKQGLKRFETTSEDFVLIGQLEKGKIRQKAVDATLQSVVASAATEARYSGHKVLTKGVQKMTIHQPTHLLKRVVASLVDNAVTHGKSTKPTEVSALSSGNTAELRITDHGKGIEKEKLSVLFKPLSRVEEAEDFTHEGAGLSLYVNRLIMHYLSGSITAQSKPGQGTTMTVTVPRYYDNR